MLVINRVISPGDRVLVVQRVNGYDRRTFHATVVEWTPRDRLKVKKGVDDKVVIVSPEDVKKLADGKPVEASQPDEKASEKGIDKGEETPKAVLLYLPK